MKLKKRGYLLYRRLKGFGVKCLFFILRVFPIKDNRICVCTFEGKGGFGCNPKYIVEELHKRNPNYEFIWLVNDMNMEFPNYIKKAQKNLINSAYWLSTSKIWIDNYRKIYGATKRKGQYYINTWHGTTGFKSIGLWRGDAFSKIAYLVSKNDSDMIDCVPVDSEWCKQYYPKGLVYEGELLKTGSARCDILYGDRQAVRRRFRKKHNLSMDINLVMFAPTFREKSVDGKRCVFSELWTLDFKRLLGNFEKRFGGEWVLCLRLHPQLTDCVSDTYDKELKDKIIDISKDPDMYEALAAMDALVTDYSSVAMDAGIAGIPVFIYADDVDDYAKARGNLSWDMENRKQGKIKNNPECTPNIDLELPFSLSENNDEMEKNIIWFEESSYLEKIEAFSKAIGLVFDGKASERIADKIEGWMK